MANCHGQTLEISTDGNGAKIGIKIAEPTGVTSDNLPLSTWGASYILADQLHALDVSEFLSHVDRGAEDEVPEPVNFDILELGAGTGLVGVTAASLWKCNAILTDLPGIVPGVQANIEANADVLSKSKVSAVCGSLDWASPDRLSLQQPPGSGATSFAPADHKFPLILAADVVYDEDHPALLTKTVSTWLAPGNASRFMWAYPLRISYLDHIREMWQRLEDAGLESVADGQRVSDPSWDEEAPIEWCVWKWKEKF